MKRRKSTAVLLLTGFLAFAPPGTMVLIFAILIGLWKRPWLAAAAALCLAALIIAWVLARRRFNLRGKTQEPSSEI